MTKISENKCKKIDVEEEIPKKSHLSTTEKETLVTLWKNMKICLKEKLDIVLIAKLSYVSRKEPAKGINANLRVSPRHKRNL